MNLRVFFTRVLVLAILVSTLPAAAVQAGEPASGSLSEYYKFSSSGGLFAAGSTSAANFAGPDYSTSHKDASTDRLVIGDPLDYSISIINTGDMVGFGTLLTDTLPMGTTYLTGTLSCTSGTCTYDNSNDRILWNGDVEVGATVQVNFSVDTDGVSCEEELVNLAQILHPGTGNSASVSTVTQPITMLPFFEYGFEPDIWPPSGWTTGIITDTGFDPAWSRVTAGTNPTIDPHGGGAMAKFNSYNVADHGAAHLTTPELDFSGLYAPALYFYMSHDIGRPFDNDRVRVSVSTDGGSTYTSVGLFTRVNSNYPVPGWGFHTVDLSAYAGMNGVKVRFLGISSYGNNIFLDDVVIADPWYICPSVVLEPDSSQKTCPYTTVTYPLTVRNLYSEPDTLDIAVSSVWTTTPEVSSIALGPGGSSTFTVTVEVPWDARDGIDTATIFATGQASGLTDSAALVTYGSNSAWEDETPAPSVSMNNVVIQYNDEFYLVGGYNLAAPYKYTPLTATWTELADEPAPQIEFANDGCFGINEAGEPVILLLPDTSEATLGVFHRYNIATDTWDTPAIPAELPADGIWSPDIASDRLNNVCYISGGQVVSGAGDLNTLYAYYPAANTAESLEPMTTARQSHASWIYNDLLCVGGGVNNGVYLSSTQCYNTATSTWQPENATLGPLLYANGHMADAEQWTYDGVLRLWIMGGVGQAGYTAQTSFYNTNLGSWVASEPLAHTLYKMEADAQWGEAYVMGGSTGGLIPFAYNQRFVECPAPVMNMTVSPISFTARQCPNTVTSQMLQICNIEATGKLEWALSELEQGVPTDLPWLFEDPSSDSVWMGQCQEVTIGFDTSDIDWGEYVADLLLTSNDVDLPEVTMPVTLTVDEAADILEVTFATDLLTAVFTSTVVGLPPVDYLWDFGDGSASNEPNPTHTYQTGGSYDVTLTVANSCAVDVWSGEVFLCEPATNADFTWDPSAPGLGETVTFTGTVLGTGPFAFAWDFGDGDMDSGQTTSHLYTEVGVYTVEMTVSNACSITTVDYDITVNQSMFFYTYLPMTNKD